MKSLIRSEIVAPTLRRSQGSVLPPPLFSFRSSGTSRFPSVTAREFSPTRNAANPINLIPPHRFACQYAIRGVEDEVMLRVQYAEYLKQPDAEAQTDNVRCGCTPAMDRQIRP